MQNSYGKREEIYGCETLHREIGYYIARLEKYNKSLKFFDAAIKKTPDDKRALIGRSRSRAKAAQYEGALEDINHALSSDPDDLEVLAEKAFNTYLCCEFEEGLVQNTRLLPKRRKPDVFSMGVMHCTAAIDNCLGEIAGRPLRDHFKIIRKLAWKRNYAAQKPFEPTPQGKTKKKKKCVFQQLFQNEHSREPVQPKHMRSKSIQTRVNLEIKDSLHSKESDKEVVPPYTQPFPFRPLQHHTTNIENYMAEKYLDHMYRDKVFLKQIPSEPGASCPNSKGTAKIKQIARQCYSMVLYKQELLRTRRPFYFIKYQEARVSGALKERQKVELQHQRHLVKREADAILQKMMEAYTDKKLHDFLTLVEKLKQFCDSKSKKLLPDKADYMDAIYDTVCKAFYDVYRVNKDHSSFEQTRRIYATLGVPLSREPSTDSVICQFKNVFQDHKKQIQEYENRLKDAVLPEEICWFYHELSRLYIEQKEFELSRVYARKCMQTARSFQNDRWMLNSSMLMCKSNMQQHNKNDAKNDLQLALKSAEKLKDNDKIAYLNKCIDVVESVEFDNLFGVKQLEKREQKIIEMMSTSKMKDEAAHLFRQMAAMPASRRMTVVPGVRVSAKDTKSKGRSMSIMPREKSEQSGSLAAVKSRSISKSTDQQKAKELMDLIELHL